MKHHKNALHCTLNGRTGFLLRAPGLRVEVIEIIATTYGNGEAQKLGGFMPALAILSIDAKREPVAITTFSHC